MKVGSSRGAIDAQSITDVTRTINYSTQSIQYVTAALPLETEIGGFSISTPPQLNYKEGIISANIQWPSGWSSRLFINTLPRFV